MEKGQKVGKPKGFHTKRVAFKPTNLFKPSATTFKARSQMTFQFGRPSKTQAAAQKALKEVYGEESKFQTEKIAFKQKAYAQAYSNKVAKNKAKILTAGPTKWYQGISRVKQWKAIRNVAQLKAKKDKYNAKSADLIAKLSAPTGTKLAQNTLKPLTNPDGTVKTRTSLANTLAELKTAYNTKKSGDIEAQKTKIADLIAVKQNINNAVTKADFTIRDLKSQGITKGPAFESAQAALATAKTAKSNYNSGLGKTHNAEISKLTKKLKTTNKMSTIKFNNLYSVAKGSVAGLAVKRQARLDLFAIQNSSKALKQEAKRASMNALTKTHFFKKNKNYRTAEAQTKLLAYVERGKKIRNSLRNPNGTQKKFDFFTRRALKRELVKSLKAESLLRTLNRSSLLQLTPEQKTKVSGVLQKSPIDLYKTGEASTTVGLKVRVDDAKQKADAAEVKLTANKAQIATNGADILKLETQNTELGAKKTELESKSKDLDAQIASRIENGKSLKTPALIQSNQAEIDKLTKEKAEVTYNIKINENDIQKTKSVIDTKTAANRQIEAENQIHEKTKETHKTLETQYKLDAPLKVAENVGKINTLTAEVDELKLKRIELMNAVPPDQDAIKENKYELIVKSKEKLKLVEENKIHEEALKPLVTTPPVVTTTPTAPVVTTSTVVTTPTVVTTEEKVKEAQVVTTTPTVGASVEAPVVKEEQVIEAPVAPPLKVKTAEPIIPVPPPLPQPLPATEPIIITTPKAKVVSPTGTNSQTRAQSAANNISKAEKSKGQTSLVQNRKSQLEGLLTPAPVVTTVAPALVAERKEEKVKAAPETQPPAAAPKPVLTLNPVPVEPPPQISNATTGRVIPQPVAAPAPVGPESNA